MRTTVDIDEDLLAALKDLARRQGSTLGQIMSALARRALAEPGTPEVRNGVRLFAPKVTGHRPDLTLVNALRDEA